MRRLTTVVATVLTLIAHSALALQSYAALEMPFGEDSGITVLSEGTAARKALFRTHLQMPAVVWAYDPLDVNSVRMAPTIGTAAQSLKGFASVFALNTRAPSMQLMLDALQVQATPTLKLIPAQGKSRKIFEKSPLKSVGAGTRQVIDFQEKNFLPETIRKWALSHLPQVAIEKVVSDEGKHKLIEACDKALENDEDQRKDVVVLFTDKDATSQLYKALSVAFYGRLSFFEVNAKKASKTADHYRVEKFPTLMVFSGLKDKKKRIHGPVTYDGKLNIQDLTIFLEKYSMSAEKFDQLKYKKANKIVKKEIKKAAAGPLQEVRTTVAWAKEVLQRKKLSGILFSDPTANDGADHKSMLDTMGSLLRSDKGKAATKGQRYFWIDKSKNLELAEAFVGDIANEEAVVLAFYNPKKQLVTKYVGAFTEKNILAFINGKIAAGKGAKELLVDDLPSFEEAEGSLEAALDEDSEEL